MDYEPEGFEWINCTYNDENIAIFIRKTRSGPRTPLLFVCNFVPVAHEKFRVGVPFAGKYKEILNSDSVKFGGTGATNPRVKASKKRSGMPGSIRSPLPPAAFRHLRVPVYAGEGGAEEGDG